jgi:hypothetical protein
MFFHIDEAGNTGNNLFDFEQPRLSYGVLSSVRNVDVLCVRTHQQILREIDATQIHANQLGLNGLVKIASYLIDIQRKMQFDFDYYFIEKKDYALISFFSAVFDAGLNKAVKWDTYWTPIKFMIIRRLAALFDESLLKESWRLCTERNIEKNKGSIVQLLSTIKERAELSRLDARSIEIIVDALNFGIARPLELDFGSPDPMMISPNAVGFQFVVSCIARRVRKKGRKKVSSIIVDRQNQFNNAQIGTHYNLTQFSEGIKNVSQSKRNYIINHPSFVTLEEEDITYEGLPDRQLTISNSADSIGLQVVDVYLWLANRMISGTELPEELRYLWSLFSHRCSYDEISLDGMARRFSSFLQLLPSQENFSDEQKQFAKEQIKKHREKVRSLNQG